MHTVCNARVPISLGVRIFTNDGEVEFDRVAIVCYTERTPQSIESLLFSRWNDGGRPSLHESCAKIRRSTKILLSFNIVSNLCVFDFPRIFIIFLFNLRRECLTKFISFFLSIL